jgi:DNA repair protein RadC
MSQRYRVPIYTIKLVREGSLMADERPVITEPRDIARIASEYLEGADREHLIVILVDTKNRVIGINTISVGHLNGAVVAGREVFKPAVLCNAAQIILAHNHPSGDPTPSREDLRVTKDMAQAGQVLDINLMDHVIVGSNGSYISLKERGLM